MGLIQHSPGGGGSHLLILPISQAAPFWAAVTYTCLPGTGLSIIAMSNIHMYVISRYLHKTLIHADLALQERFQNRVILPALHAMRVHFQVFLRNHRAHYAIREHTPTLVEPCNVILAMPVLGNLQGGLRAVSTVPTELSQLSWGRRISAYVEPAVLANIQIKDPVLFVQKGRTRVARELMNASIASLELTLLRLVLTNAPCAVQVNIPVKSRELHIASHAHQGRIPM
jgi:hypothetical protein